MGPSRMMASSSSANSDLTGQSSASSHLASVGRSLGSMSVEDLHHSIRGGDGGGSGREGASLPLHTGIGEKTVKEVWGEFSAHGRTDGFDTAITLEDFLTKVGVVLDGSAWIPPSCGQMDLGQGQVMGDRFGQPPQFPVENPVVRFGNGAEGAGMAGGRRKRPLLDPVDRTVAQRQKRMIKNRESAARSRERKQAYVAELESLVAQLKEDNAQLSKRLEEERMEWMKQLEEKMVPVTNIKRPRQPFRRCYSMEW